MTNKCVITATDTDVGKTVFAAMLMLALDAAYWKPVQCGVEGGVDFSFDVGGKAIAAHQDHRVQVVRVGTVFFALGRSQLNVGHVGIIGSTLTGW